MEQHHYQLHNAHKDIVELLLNMKNIDVNKPTRRQHHYILHKWS